MSAPIVPVAPARLSTSTACPQFSLIFAPMMRETISVPPPGANPTTMRMDLAGYCCAAAEAASTKEHIKTPAERFIASPRCRSLRLDPGRFDHCAPLARLGLDLRQEFRRRGGHGIHALPG